MKRRHKAGAFRRRTGGTVASYNLRSKDGVPEWYVFVDESGRLDGYDGDCFVMSGILTNDPEALAAIPTSFPTHTVTGKRNSRSKDLWKEPGTWELKWSNTDDVIHREIMDLMEKQGVIVYSVVARKEVAGNGRGRARLYEEMFAELVRHIDEEGPDGIYRFRVDESDLFDRRRFERILRDNLVSTGKQLSGKVPVNSADSDLTPCLQAADVAAGEHRRLVQEGKDLPRNSKVRNISGGIRVRKKG